MADNIMGPEVNLGLNVNLELDRSAQDAATLADQIKQMRIDQEAFRDVIADTQDRLREMTSNYQEQLSLRQQLLDTEQSLRNLSDSRTDSLRDQVSAYREMEQSMSRLTSMMGGVSMPYGGGMGGMGGMGYGGMGYGGMGFGGMSGFYNPMSGMMMNMGGFPSAFSATPAEEEAMAEESMMVGKEKEKKSMEDWARKLFYYSNFPRELENTETPLGLILHQLTGGHGILGTKQALETTGIAEKGPLKYVSEASLAGRALKLLTAIPGISMESLGALSALAVNPVVLGTVGTGIAAYKIGSDIARTGQEYGSLTGSTSPRGGYLSDFQSFLGSLGGLNPLMPTGVSKEIEAAGLAAGYGYGSNWLNQYRSFASGAYERFGINPMVAQQMFQSGGVVGGASGNQLSQALQGVANFASTSGISFPEATQQFASNLNTLSGSGLAGNALANAAAMQTAMFRSGTGQILQPVAGELAAWGQSLTGQALMANVLGIPITQMYNWEHNLKGAAGSAQYLATESRAFSPLLAGLGLQHGASMKQIRGDEMQLQALFQSMGLNLTPKETVAFANQLLNNKKGMATNIAHALAPSEHPMHAMIASRTGSVGSSIVTSANAQYAKDQRHIVEIYMKGDAGKHFAASINNYNASKGTSSTNIGSGHTR